MKYLTQQVIADLIIATFAAIFIGFGFSGDELLHKFSILWGAMCAGYLLTIYLSIDYQEEEEL